MNHALIQNFSIIILVAFGTYQMNNPLFVLGLMFLTDLPYGLHPSQNKEDEENEEDGAYQGNKIGFNDKP